VSPDSSPDGPAERSAPFACHWRLEGRLAASVRVSGELDLATAAQVERALDDALRHARLVLLDISAMSFIDCSGLHVLFEATSRARNAGAHVVLAGASEQVEDLLRRTGTDNYLEVLRVPEGVATHAAAGRADDGSIRPLDNPVNASVVAARVTAISDTELWVQAANGAIHRPWAPSAEGLPVPAGTPIELYLDASGAVNGWRDPKSGLAINQRGLETGESAAAHSDLACRGPCGVVWRAPAASRLTQRAERCLTCAGPLVLG
jgi:anti-anti-sigma factor